MSADFTRKVEGNTQHVAGHFTCQPQLVSNGHDFNFDELLRELDSKVDNFNKRASGFNLDVLTDFTLFITQFKPLSASSYILTPPSIAEKHAVINIKNFDQFCFQWAILSCLYPPKDNPHCVSNYYQYQSALNFKNISFPLKVAGSRKQRLLCRVPKSGTLSSSSF